MSRNGESQRVDCSTAELSDLFLQTDHDFLVDQLGIHSIRSERIIGKTLVIAALHVPGFLLLLHDEGSCQHQSRAALRIDTGVVTANGGNMQTFIN